MNTEPEKIEVYKEHIIKAAEMILAFCETQELDELLAYMAMISITHTMEEKFGFGNKRRTQA